MSYLQKLMLKKVNWLAAGLIIILLTLAFAYAISVRAIAPGWIIGGQVAVVVPATVCNTPLVCGACGPCGCGSWSLVVVTPSSDTSMKYMCIPAGFPVFGPGLLPGLSIMGYGASPWSPVMVYTTVSAP